MFAVGAAEQLTSSLEAMMGPAYINMLSTMQQIQVKILCLVLLPLEDVIKYSRPKPCTLGWVKF
jgi:hypothetical protein